MDSSIPPFYSYNMTVESETIHFTTTETTSTPTSVPNLSSILTPTSTSQQEIVAMPLEYLNYTITSVNGKLWAKIDGEYPIYVINPSDFGSNGIFPMVYPMPPGSTNIHVTLGGKEFSWTNYTAILPSATHRTAIGDWWMIYTCLSNVSDSFDLKIHYEHPIEIINGSCLFLYDLNISPYLSPQSNNSTAYFTIRMETNATNFKAFTAQPEAKWTPLNYTVTKENSKDILAIQVHSEYSKTLPGDLIVTFPSIDQGSKFSVITVLMTIIVLLISSIFVAVVLKHRKKR